jgi:type IV secretion system protein VirB9
MPRSLLIPLVCLTMPTWAQPSLPALAEELPRQVRQDQRVREVEYDPSQVTLVATQRLISTQVEFSPDETIVTAGIGNPSYNMVAKLNYLFVKPTEMHPPTNVNVVTQLPDGRRRTYQLVFGITPPGERRAPPFYLVRFKYSADVQARRAADAAVRADGQKAREADRVLARDANLLGRNYAYAIQGDAEFEPDEVYDNGKVTTFRFKGATELPAIYLGLEDGKDELVPKSVEGELVTVHAVAKKFVLRRADLVMGVFNERFVPEGVEPGTKTASPNVVRLTKPLASAVPNAAPLLSSGPPSVNASARPTPPITK